MSSKRPFNNVFLRSAVCAASLFTVVFGPQVAAARDEADATICDRAAFLAPDATVRWSSQVPGADLYLRVEVSEPGFLSLDAMASGLSEAEPVLVPVSTNCDGFSPGRSIVLERAMASLLLAVESPGAYVFRLTSSDPEEALSEIKVRSGHTTFGEDEEEIESEPNPFAGDGKLPDNVGEDEEEIESEPNPFAGEGAKSVSIASAWTEICSLGERDDHGDTFGCATPLTPEVAVEGEIANDWGDDADVFGFVLPGSGSTGLWRVQVSASGALDTLGGLFDRHGGRLARAQSGGGGDNFRLVRILRPGVYFVRVEGNLGAEGAYRLKLEITAP